MADYMMELLPKKKNWINKLTKSTQRHYIKKHLCKIAASWNSRYEHNLASISMKFICYDFVVSPPMHFSYHICISKTRMVSRTYNASNPCCTLCISKFLFSFLFYLEFDIAMYFSKHTQSVLCQIQSPIIATFIAP